MSSKKFVTEAWIDRLVPALTKLAEVQKPYLQEYDRRYPDFHGTCGQQDGKSQDFPLDDLLVHYTRARFGNALGEEEFYAPLCEALDSVRYILISHPTLERVASRLIDRDDFCMQILNTGGDTSPTDLIAGLFARANELEDDSFWKSVRELNEFLTPSGRGHSAQHTLGDLDVGYDTLLFWGLTLKERIDIEDGMMLLPFKEISAFVDESLVHEYAPSGSGLHRWQSVGAIVRPFRWKPEFYPAGPPLRDRGLNDPDSFFRKAYSFLELLAVAHARPVLYLAALSNCIHRSAGRLLGQSNHQSGFYLRGRSVQEFNGSELCPELNPQAFEEAKEAFDQRESKLHRKMALVIGRLAEALARDGRYSGGDRILDVAIALEYMYELDPWRVSSQLQDQVSRYLGSDAESRQREREIIKKFYKTRSDIVHGDFDGLTPQKVSETFDMGFDTARRSLFKLLRDGPPEDGGTPVSKR